MIEGTNVVVTRVPKKPLVLPADMQDDVLQQEEWAGVLQRTGY